MALVRNHLVPISFNSYYSTFINISYVYVIHSGDFYVIKNRY